MGEQYGPSWWDVGERCRSLVKRGYARPDITICANWRLDGANADISFVASVSLRTWGKNEGSTLSCAQSFGKRQTWATAPAAIHAALVLLETQLALREQTAAQQAAF